MRGAPQHPAASRQISQLEALHSKGLESLLLLSTKDAQDAVLRAKAKPTLPSVFRQSSTASVASFSFSDKSSFACSVIATTH